MGALRMTSSNCSSCSGMVRSPPWCSRVNFAVSSSRALAPPVLASVRRKEWHALHRRMHVVDPLASAASSVS